MPLLCTLTISFWQHFLYLFRRFERIRSSNRSNFLSMRRIKVLIAILLIISTGTNAQSVRGRLLDLNENKPLRGATLRLTGLTDSSQIFNSISDSTGRFEF